MSQYLIVTAILDWYDGPLLILGKDDTGTQYLGTLVARFDKYDQYLCAPITKEQLDLAAKNKLDALDVYKGQEILAYLSTVDYTETGRGELSFVPYADVPLDHFIGEGFYFTPTDCFAGDYS